jgi:hypothetical protein
MLTFLASFTDFTRSIAIILWGNMWTWGIFTIAFYFASIGWGIFTWIPVSGYTVGTFALAWFLNQARQATWNGDDKTWLTDEARTALIRKHFRREVKE